MCEGGGELNIKNTVVVFQYDGGQTSARPWILERKLNLLHFGDDS